ncbi:Hypothetical protein HDN1F_34100 [gamma proteobacterium HdN1]|nr:Hypothetical protein HDN1F_34100 [gamma proteobacterium HdN1]
MSRVSDRKSTWFLAGIFITLAVVVGVALWLWIIFLPPSEVLLDSSDHAPQSIAVPAPALTGSQTQHRSDKAAVSESDAFAPLQQEPPAQTPKLESALNNMRQSLSEGDARTPELAPDLEREKPSAAALEDPAAYADYEATQAHTTASAWMQAFQKIPELRARIDAAKAAGDKSDEEIAEAEDALVELEKMRDELKRENPELFVPSGNSLPEATQAIGKP